MERLMQVLTELKPYIIVVGSYARKDTHANSDIDFYIKRRPQEVLDKDLYGEVKEHYVDKVIEIFNKYNLSWDSCTIGSVGTCDLPVMLDGSSMFTITKSAEIFKLNLYGVELEAAIDDKDAPSEEHIDYYD